MIGSGFYVVHGTTAKLHFAVDIKETYAGIAVFEVVQPEDLEGLDIPARAVASAPWSDVEAYLMVPVDTGNKAGFQDLQYNGLYVPDLPGTASGGVYLGRSYMFADGMNGLDEMVDYSLLDIMTDPSGAPLPWRNRFAQSKPEKVDYSFRFRAMTRNSNALVVFMPFDTGSFLDCRVELLCEIDPILLNGTTVTGRVPDADIPKDGQWFKQWYFSAVPDATTLTVPAGGSVDLPFHLTWNADGSACQRATRFKLETDAGFLPKTRVVTDANGQGVVRVHALGLEPGDRMKVKINAEHYTAVGVLNVEVV
jgi:hypothetical protein